MQIISHRGYWNSIEEKNQSFAFGRSFSSGFGLETDIRDQGGCLVISHDVPVDGCMTVEELFKMYQKLGDALPLALNIKSDGLQLKLKALIGEYNIQNYFVFDMSVPDMLGYIKEGIYCFTRQSEYEMTPALYETSSGVWVDSFEEDWVSESIIDNHFANGKKVCLVSPELHRRNYFDFWERLKKFSYVSSNDLLLCTDHPVEARSFFCG